MIRVQSRVPVRNYSFKARGSLDIMRAANSHNPDASGPPSAASRQRDRASSSDGNSSADQEASRGPPAQRQRTTASRAVGNLSQEQLDRKRQNDREAQRAIRERTKQRIESLERELQHLRATRDRSENHHRATIAEQAREIEWLRAQLERESVNNRGDPASPSTMSSSARSTGQSWQMPDIGRLTPSAPSQYPNPQIQASPPTISSRRGSQQAPHFQTLSTPPIPPAPSSQSNWTSSDAYNIPSNASTRPVPSTHDYQDYGVVNTQSYPQQMVGYMPLMAGQPQTVQQGMTYQQLQAFQSGQTLVQGQGQAVPPRPLTANEALFAQAVPQFGPIRVGYIPLEQQQASHLGSEETELADQQDVAAFAPDLNATNTSGYFPGYQQ